MPALVILQDFANIFKAFIGTNYLTVSFAFKESGLLLGLIGIVFIVLATAHCCHLIVKCKKEVVSRIIANPNSLHGHVSSRLLSISVTDLERTITYGDIARAVLGKFGSILTNLGLFVTQFGFCVSYFIFIADTMEQAIEKFVHSNSTNDSVITMEEGSMPRSVLPDELNNWSLSQSMVSDSNKDGSTKDVVDYHLLLLIPFPFFMAFAMMRRIRDMGPLSAFANFAVLVGFLSITVIIAKDFHVNKDITWFADVVDFPIFFGQVTSAYEGIGTIIPIETSMEGSRKLYPILLYLALLLFTSIYSFMGILGYLNYGNGVSQVLIWSLTGDASPVMVLLINITICVGVLFTYPLQNFVAVEIVEGIIFGSAIHESSESLPALTGNGEARSPLLSSGIANETVQDEDEEVVTRQPHAKIPFYKRFIVRALMVIIQFGIAFFLKDSYAYFSALIGAVGSTMLAYILPCLIHLRLGGRSRPVPIIVKDVLLVFFGVVGMLTGVYSSIYNIINNLDDKN